jgi:addiction module HigA family antidote
MAIIKRPAMGWNIKGITTHPGEMLLEEFLKPMNISQNKLALDIHVPATRISQIVKGERAVTPDTALRFSMYFGNSPEFWLNLQQMHDLTRIRHDAGKQIEREVHPLERGKGFVIQSLAACAEE